MDKLKDLEAVAYVRFASVYREFKDVNSFVEELKKVLVNKIMRLELWGTKQFVWHLLTQTSIYACNTEVVYVSKILSGSVCILYI